MSKKAVDKIDLKHKISQFPNSPGVYMMRNAYREVLYVGKAKNLKVRVSSYYNGLKDPKTSFLLRKTVDIEVILTRTEYEALILENNLIKKYRPRYNINLKDGKSYPVIRITNEKFPRVFRTRNITQDGSTFYGPYSTVKTVDLYIELIRKLFPLRRCTYLKPRKSPCLYAHIDRCPAPCVGKISEEEYGRNVRKVKSLLSGKTVGLRKELEKKMRDASVDLAFEKAAEFRDLLAALDVLDSQMLRMNLQTESQDYVEKTVSGRFIVFGVMQMRGGNILGRELYTCEYMGDVSEALQEFLIQYYVQTNREIPVKLILSEDLDDLTKEFFQQYPEIPEIILPGTKQDKVILAMVKENTEAELHRRVSLEGDIPALKELKRVLHLPRTPRRIEGFDISHLGGRDTTASLISFIDGRPDRAGYRHYKIRSTAGGVNDYQAIAEAVGRRYQRLINEKLPMPDLLLVDGGKGQVSSALAVMEALGLAKKIPLLGLAKRNEEIWLAGSKEPIRLPEGDPGLRILQHIRDETHRFATGYQKRLREKGLALSVLEGIPGIGKSRSRKLMTTYGSLEGIYQQSLQEIATTAGIGAEAAETVREFLVRSIASRRSAKASRDQH